MHYGWLHSGEIASEIGGGSFLIFKRLTIMLDILKCFRRYKMWSNQYKKEKFYSLNKEDRKRIGAKYYDKGIYRDAWQKDFNENSKFFAKYASIKYQAVDKHAERNKAYMSRYGIGEGSHIGYNVEIVRHHYLPGTIRFGKKLLLAANVHIDYSGHVVIEDGVKLTNGVVIESHHRDLVAYKEGKDVNIQSDLLIRENAYIGTRAIILDGCHYIGKNARIGAGAVVTKDIPDNAVAVGVPAKVIKILEE